MTVQEAGRRGVVVWGALVVAALLGGFLAHALIEAAVWAWNLWPGWIR